MFPKNLECGGLTPLSLILAAAHEESKSAVKCTPREMLAGGTPLAGALHASFT